MITSRVMSVPSSAHSRRVANLIQITPPGRLCRPPGRDTRRDTSPVTRRGAVSLRVALPASPPVQTGTGLFITDAIACSPIVN